LDHSGEANEETCGRLDCAVFEPSPKTRLAVTCACCRASSHVHIVVSIPRSTNMMKYKVSLHHSVQKHVGRWNMKRPNKKGAYKPTHRVLAETTQCRQSARSVLRSAVLASAGATI